MREEHYLASSWDLRIRQANALRDGAPTALNALLQARNCGFRADRSPGSLELFIVDAGHFLTCNRSPLHWLYPARASRYPASSSS
jgi:hypothetical protein